MPLVPQCVDDVLACLGGRKVCGVDDLGLLVQSGASRFGVGVEVLQSERGRAQQSVCLDSPPKGVTVSVEDEVPDRDGMVCKVGADLAPVPLGEDFMGITSVPPV